MLHRMLHGDSELSHSVPAGISAPLVITLSVPVECMFSKGYHAVCALF